MRSRGKQMDRSPSKSTCVKLYLCSNPEDSVMERRTLRETVFPKLRELCRHTMGLDLRVIDPFESSDPRRWPDENTRQQLIKECRESSAGPFLMALVGHQYGQASLPAQVEVSEFQMLLQQSQQAGVSTQELERVYQRDQNTIPASYCLRPLHRNTFCCPQQADVKEGEEIKMKAKEEKELRMVIQSSVSLCVRKGHMNPDRANSYYRSALDADLRFALDNRPKSDIIGRCLVYVHKVINATGEGKRSQVKTPGSQAADDDQRTTPTDGQLFSELCDTFLPGLIMSAKLLVYTISTECDRRHGYTTARRRIYTQSLCQQVHSDLVGLIDRRNVLNTSEGSQPGDALAREQAEQEELCHILSRFYDVIRPEEEEIRAYVEQSEQRHPLVLTGGPCTGKTVLLAHCAQKIKSWLPDCDPVVLTYFFNLSISPSLEHLLFSLCYQIAIRYPSKSPLEQNLSDLDDPSCITNLEDYNSNCTPSTSYVDPRHEPTTREHLSDHNQDLSTVTWSDPSGIKELDICMSKLKERLSSLLSFMPSTKQPLIIILDVLGHTKNNFGTQIIESLPSPLPPNVRLILKVSLNQRQALQAINTQRSHYLSEASEKESGYMCVQLGLVDRIQCVKMLASLLSSRGRRVTSGQQVLVNQALTSCCLTLYARLLHLHTSLWHSDSDVSESSLPDGIHSSISVLLDHLEQKHGPSIVGRAVSYLTLSKTGLTEAELADLLSCDDEVLSECVQQGESPTSNMRLPQINTERLLLDLRGVLLSRTVSGSCVLFWVSRHFKLVVARTYLGTHELRREIHSAMADYFSGRWACGSTKPLLVNQKSGPNKDAVQKEVHIDRQTCSQQPFVFACSPKEVGRANLRKVLELPHHLKESERWKELEQDVLMCFGFHQAMVQAGLLRDLVAMMECREWSSHFCFPRERALLASILKSCSCLLQSSPLQLAAVIEANLFPYLGVFPALKSYVREIRREERRKTGSGLGIRICPAPSSVPSIECLKCDATSEDVSVTEAARTECGVVTEIMDDGTAWVLNGSGCGLAKLSLSCEQKELKFAGVKSSGTSMLLTTQCNKLFLWDVTGPETFLQLKEPLKTEFEPQSSPQMPIEIEGFVVRQKKLLMWWKDKSFVSVFDVPSETFNHVQCLHNVTCLVCSSNGFYMYCGQEEGMVSFFDTNTGSLLGTCSNSNHTAIALMILCEDSWEMTCVDRAGNVTLWDIAAKTQPPRLVKEILTMGKSNSVVNTDYSDEIDTLLVCQSHQVTLWDTCHWELLDQFLAPQGRAFTQAVLSQDGHLFLALLHTCQLVLVWRVSTGDCVLALETNKQPHALLKLASDVICVAHDGCLTMWDSRMIDAAGATPKMGCGVKEVVVEGTGEWFYTVDGSDTVWRWRLETGLPHDNFLHDGPVEKLKLSPDNIHIVTLSAGEIYVWQTETGQNILRMSGNKVTDILITPNCNFGVSISDRQLSRVWKLVHGSIVCSIHLYLTDAQVSPESTFLIGLRRGDLLAASLWTGSISKRFSGVVSWEHVVAFSTLSEHPDCVVVMAASGAVYTWKVAEETVCKHFQLPHTFHCQPQDFQMTSNGNYALLSTEKEGINLLDLSQVRLCSIKADGLVTKACLDKTGCYVAYISCPSTQDKSCVCSLHARPVLTVVRLADGERIGSVRLSKSLLTLVVSEQFVFIGFEDGSVGVFSVLDGMSSWESVGCRENFIGQSKKCPFDRTPLTWLPQATPNSTWP